MYVISSQAQERRRTPLGPFLRVSVSLRRRKKNTKFPSGRKIVFVRAGISADRSFSPRQLRHNHNIIAFFFNGLNKVRSLLCVLTTEIHTMN
jgi:hypothetical protein